MADSSRPQNTGVPPPREAESPGVDGPVADTSAAICGQSSFEFDQGKHTDLIAKAYASYQAAERAYYENALFPFFGSGIELTPHWKEEVTGLRKTLLRARDFYFEALTTA